MKFNTLIFCSLLIGFNSFSQDLEKIKSQDVVFVVFGNSKGEKKFTNRNPKPVPINKYYFRFYYDSVGTAPLTKSIDIELGYYKYDDFDEQLRDNPMPIFHISKRFLKNNKDLLIDFSLIKEIGYSRTVDIFRKAKHIFLVDKTEIINKKITVKEVSFFDPDSGTCGYVEPIVEYVTDDG